MLSSFIGIVGAGMVNGLNTYLFRDYLEMLPSWQFQVC